MPRLFALDHNFPDPIVSVLAEFQADAELVRVDQIDERTDPDQPQAWTLNAINSPHREPWDYLKRFAAHNNRATDEVWAEFKLSPKELATNPLA
jgi:hypothetical protein